MAALATNGKNYVVSSAMSKVIAASHVYGISRGDTSYVFSTTGEPITGIAASRIYGKQASMKMGTAVPVTGTSSSTTTTVNFYWK